VDEKKIIVNPVTILMEYSTIFIESDEYIEDNYPEYNRILW